MKIRITCQRCGKTEWRSNRGRPIKYCLACHREMNKIMQRDYHRRERAAAKVAA